MLSKYSPTPTVKPTVELQMRAAALVKLQDMGVLDRNRFDEYMFDPVRYIKDILGWEPWAGTEDAPGQIEVIEAYVLCLRQQFERRAFERGEIEEADLKYWKPGQVIQNRIRVEAGHSVGKTKLLSGLVNHFLDCFIPSIIYTFAPTWSQIKHLLWKEIRTDREGKGLPGRILETCEIKISANHFAQGRAAGKAAGTEGIQGQHGEFLMFIKDEAEGVADFVYDAVDSMAAGGISVIFDVANPKTRTSRFYKERLRSVTKNFRISCLNHPNVREGKELVRGAVLRQYVETMLEKHCEEVPQHNVDDFTFELPWFKGTIYKPDREFMFRVLGVAPKNSTIDTMIPNGRFEAAKVRGKDGPPVNPTFASFGCDAARFGDDLGKIYLRLGDYVTHVASIEQQDSFTYWNLVRTAALKLPSSVTRCMVRVDGTGGFGSGVIDLLLRDVELRERFDQFDVFEVHFGGAAHQNDQYKNIATELYACAAEAMLELAIDPRVPATLEGDLTDRKYEWAQVGARSVKYLHDKDVFRKLYGRSPDDGDGFVLAVAPDFIFTSRQPKRKPRVTSQSMSYWG